MLITNATTATHAPTTHLSYSPGYGWVLMHQGFPLCDYRPTRQDAEKVATHYRLTLPDVVYVDYQWIPVLEVQHG